jgi:hypothetical protein
MLVVIRDVRGEDVVEVSATDDQQPIKALAASATDPAFGVCPCFRRPHGRFDYADALRAEDLVELAGELTVTVTDKEQRPNILAVEVHEQVARLLRDPAPVGVGRDPGETNTPGRDFDKEQDVEALQKQRVNFEEVALEDAYRLPPQELSPALLEPPGCRLDPGLPQDRPNRARRELDTEPGEFAVDPPVPPASLALSMSSRTSDGSSSTDAASAPDTIRSLLGRSGTPRHSSEPPTERLDPALTLSLLPCPGRRQDRRGSRCSAVGRGLAAARGEQVDVGVAPERKDGRVAVVVDVCVDGAEHVGACPSAPARAEHDQVVAAAFQFCDYLVARVAAPLHCVCSDSVG